VRIDLSLNNEIPINRGNNQNNIIFLTYLGLWKILATFRDDYTTWIYHRMSEYEYNRIRYKRYGKKELTFKVGSELKELYKKYCKFLKTLKQIKSPIERWFYIWAWDKIDGLEWQYPIDKLHVDFAIHSLKIAIENDGRDTHSKVEDINRDNRRDAFLNSEGWQIQKFTGSQIYNNVERCVDRVLKIIENKKAALSKH